MRCTFALGSGSATALEQMTLCGQGENSHADKPECGVGWKRLSRRMRDT